MCPCSPTQLLLHQRDQFPLRRAMLRWPRFLDTVSRETKATWAHHSAHFSQSLDPQVTASVPLRPGHATLAEKGTRSLQAVFTKSK